MRRKLEIAVPEWARKIEDMRQTRKLSQEGFGSRVGVSAMAVSRWERGVAEPTGETYIRLGNLADAPLCWFFWKRAGLRLSDVTRVLPEANRRFAENRIFDVQVANAGSKKRHSLAQVDLVAIPLLPVHAGTPGSQGDTSRSYRYFARISVGGPARLVSRSGFHGLSSRKGEFDVSPNSRRIHHRGGYVFDGQ